MKKKFLTVVLALAMAAGMAAMTVGCDGDDDASTATATATHTHTYATEWTTDDTHHWKAATCEHNSEVSEKAEHSYGADGKCTVCQKEKSVVATVTQAEWMAFFHSLSTISFEAEMNTPEMNSVQTVKQHNSVTYQTQAMGENLQRQYVLYDDATYTMTRYSDHAGTWKKYTTVYNNAEEYTTIKVTHMGLAETVFGSEYSLQQSGEPVGLGELYSGFTYDSDSGVYTANVYYVEDGVGYYESVWTLKFENGKVVSGSLAMSMSGQTMNTYFIINYGVTELVIPSEVLSAPENG